MIDFLLYYSLASVVWGVWIEVLQHKGILAKFGMVLFFPFIAMALYLETLAEKR